MNLEDCRPEVQAFAILMEEKLRRNDSKGGWKNTPYHWLLGRVREEINELEAAMQNLVAANDMGTCEDIRDCRAKAAREAADIANFAMMIADNLGGLKR